MNMTAVQFYSRYEDVATRVEALNASRPELSDKEERIEQLEINQEMNKVFTDFVGSQIDFSA